MLLPQSAAVTSKTASETNAIRDTAETTARAAQLLPNPDCRNQKCVSATSSPLRVSLPAHPSPPTDTAAEQVLAGRLDELVR